MALSKFEKDMNIVAALDDEPNDVGGLTAAELKAKFDEGGNAVKKYLNDTLIPEIESQKANTSDLQGLVLGQIPDGTITSEKLADGSVTSEKLSQDAIPSSYSKTEILDGSVLGVFSGDEISEDSLPKDILQYLAMALGAMEHGKGVLLVYATTAEGDPVVGQIVTISGTFGAVPLSDSGSAVVVAEPGSYTVDFDDTGFYEPEATEKVVSVSAGKIAVCRFSCSLKTSGTIIIEQSTTLFVPALFPLVDLFAAGGGGSGGVCAPSTGNFRCAGGGAGGYTTTLLNQNLAGRTIKISIGAGAEAAVVTSSTLNGVKSGSYGGKTTVEVDDEILLTANGGGGGAANSNFGYGGKGGSGGGGVYSDNSQFSADLAGGSNGSDSNNAKYPTYNGKGQGTTTRAFGDPDGVLCSAGGGAVYRINDFYITGQGGANGGGDGENNPSSVVSGNPGEGYGDGGGAVIGAINSTSGAGHDGVVMIRWGVSM